MYAGHVACCRLVSHGMFRMDRQTDGKTSDRCITFSARRDQRNKKHHFHKLNVSQLMDTELTILYFQHIWLDRLYSSKTSAFRIEPYCEFIVVNCVVSLESWPVDGLVYRTET